LSRVLVFPVIKAPFIIIIVFVLAAHYKHKPIGQQIEKFHKKNIQGWFICWRTDVKKDTFLGFIQFVSRPNVAAYPHEPDSDWFVLEPWQDFTQTFICTHLYICPLFFLSEETQMLTQTWLSVFIKFFSGTQNKCCTYGNIIDIKISTHSSKLMLHQTGYIGLSSA